MGYSYGRGQSFGGGGPKNTKVTGLIITQEFDDKLRYALSAVDNVKMMNYKVKFFLEEK